MLVNAICRLCPGRTCCAALQGPCCMSTETKERFKGTPAADVNLYHKSVGSIENTGYTSNHNIEPLTFHPDYAYLNDAPVCHFNHYQLLAKLVVVLVVDAGWKTRKSIRI